MPVLPRHAATVILVRGGAGALEVLLVRRTPLARFAPGAWVFPGGAIDDADGDVEDEAAQRLAAVRELAEEAGVVGVDPATLLRYSRWITPPQRPIRFDTHFFLAAAPPGTAVVVDGTETIDHLWIAPGAALDRSVAGELEIIFPTRTHLTQLAGFASADALLEHAARVDVVELPARPGIGERSRIALPGDEGY